MKWPNILANCKMFVTIAYMWLMVNNGQELNTDIMIGTALLDIIVISMIADITLVNINK